MANADDSNVHHSTHPAEIMVQIRSQKFMVMKFEGHCELQFCQIFLPEDCHKTSAQS